MKHKKIVPIDCKNGNYTVKCILGNFHISKTRIKNKDVFSLYAYSKNSYAQSLVRKYDSKLNREEITYKSLNDVVVAIEKVCNLYYTNEIKFYYGE